MFGRISEAQQAKISHEKSKGLRAGSIPSKKGLIIRGMLTLPDRPLGLDGRKSYRELRLEWLCCPHRLSRGTAPHEREYSPRKDRFWAARSQLEHGTFDRSAR